MRKLSQQQRAGYWYVYVLLLLRVSLKTISAAAATNLVLTGPLQPHATVLIWSNDAMLITKTLQPR
jgi:hypothetical protein